MKTTPRSVHSRVWIIQFSVVSSSDCRLENLSTPPHESPHQMLTTDLQMLPSYFGCGEDRDEQGGSGGFFYVGTALCIFALDQAHHASDLETEGTRSLYGIHRRGAGRADIIYDDYARALL